MSQTLGPIHPAPATADDCAWLRGRKLVHKLVLAMVDPGVCLAGVLGELGSIGGALESLSVHPTGQGSFDAVLRISRVSSDEAMALLDRLTLLPTVRSAALEHLLIT